MLWCHKTHADRREEEETQTTNYIIVLFIFMTKVLYFFFFSCSVLVVIFSAFAFSLRLNGNMVNFLSQQFFFTVFVLWYCVSQLREYILYCGGVLIRVNFIPIPGVYITFYPYVSPDMVHALLPAHRLTDNRPAALGHWKSFHYIINVCVCAAVNADDKKKLPSQRKYVHDRIVTWATRHQTTNDTSKRKKSVKIKWI